MSSRDKLGARPFRSRSNATGKAPGEGQDNDRFLCSVDAQAQGILSPEKYAAYTAARDRYELDRKVHAYTEAAPSAPPAGSQPAPTNG